MLAVAGFFSALKSFSAIYTGHISYGGRRATIIVIYQNTNPGGFWFVVAIYMVIAAFLFYFALRKVKS
jgi:hypothetical protein